MKAFIHVPNNRVTRLANLTCPYCGARGSGQKPMTDDHVVGRRFVPKGAFAGGWNLIVQACDPCNNEKADLEDDISAITLQADLQDPHDDAALASEARRKALGAVSRRTRKRVADSQEEHSFEGRMMPGLNVSFSGVSPPQLDQARAQKLARLHLHAFFYLITYEEKRREGGFIPGKVGHVAEANRPDWGNRLMRAFAELTKEWPLGLVCVCAQEFFKIIIRKHPSADGLWSFAIEWNKRHRLIGFFGDMEIAQALVNELPQLKWKRWDATRRFREEIALKPEDDVLFGTPELASSV